VKRRWIRRRKRRKRKRRRRRCGVKWCLHILLIKALLQFSLCKNSKKNQ